MKYFFLILLIYIPSSSFLQEQIDSTNTSFVPNKNPVLNVTRIPNGSITIDGVLNEPEWKTAAVAENFTEIAPGDNVKPEVETIGYIMYDDDYIYFGFECYDDMKSIRASMTDRDRMFNDDWVGAFIDTYGNLKEAYEFFVNPYGIQGDLYWTPNYETSSEDFLFTSEAKIHKDKWVLEMKIPFKSLKFPNKKVQEWRVHLVRNRPRNLRQRIYWSSVARDNPNFVGQSGIFRGIENIQGGKNLEILPYVIGQGNAKLSSPVNSNSNLEHDKLKGDFGFDVKYDITSNVSLNATYNPDFSQVEADAPQLNINQPFALFFQEKRPFFLGGISAFRTLLGNAVYTRSINNPIFASKVTGSTGKWSFGYMNAMDENTPFIIPLEERSFVLPSNKYSFSNILRVKYDLGGENYIGGLITDKEISADTSFTSEFTGYNRTLGIDFNFNFLNNFYFGGQLTAFATREISDTSFFNNQTKFGSDNEYNVGFNGETYKDFSALISLNRSSDNYGFFSEYQYTGPTARRELGFSTRNNFQNIFMYHYYNFYPKGDLIRKITPDLTGMLKHNITGGIIKDQWAHPGITFEFYNGTRLWGNYIFFNNEHYRGQWIKNIERWNFGIENYSLREFGIGMFYERGKYIARFAPVPFAGHGQFINIWSTVKPIDRVVSDFNYIYNDLARSAGGEMLFAGWILSNTTKYQFNKNLFTRLVVQYDSFNDSFSFDPLISYKWNPFTILYIGSTHRFDQIEDSNNIQKNVLKESSRTYFLKFQYLWQM
jgi:hypothetical protein